MSDETTQPKRGRKTKDTKPADQLWSEYEAPKKLNHQHLAMIDLAALGTPTVAIAARLEMTPEYVGRLLRSPEISERVNSQREKCFESIAKEQLASLTGLAFGRLYHLLTSEAVRANTQLQAAQFVYENVVGKAKQKIEQTTSISILEIRRSLDELAANGYQPPPVPNRESEAMSKTLNNVDEFLDSRGARNFVVGKRSEG